MQNALIGQMQILLLLKRCLNLSEVQVPLAVDASKTRRECSVWDWTGEAVDEGNFASEYLSDFMGHKGKLFMTVYHRINHLRLKKLLLATLQETS